MKQDVLPWCAAHDVGAISYSPLFRGLLFGTWSKDKTFPADDGRSTHKDYAGARFQRHLQAVDEIRAVAASGGLSVPQLCVGVLLQTPGLTGVIVGARNARQGGADRQPRRQRLTAEPASASSRTISEQFLLTDAERERR